MTTAGFPSAQTDSPPERRWRTIGGLGIVQIVSWGSSYYLLAVLAGPIEAATGWSLTWIMGALSAGLLVAGLVSPLVGDTIARLGGRPVLASASLGFVLGLCVLGLAPSLPVFLAGWVIMGLAMGAGLYSPAFATLGRLYGSSARSAITVLTLWGGFASTVCWPASAWLVEHLGWRGACLSYAALHLGLCLPLILLAIPREKAEPGRSAARRGTGADLKGPGEKRAFVLFAAMAVIAATATTIVSVHLLTFLQAQGMSLAAAVGLGALIGPSQVGGRILEMARGGRHHPIWSLLAAVVLVAAGLLLLAWGAALPAVALILYGAGNGIKSIADGTLPLALFGPERYAGLMGRLARPSLIAQALAPSLGAFLLVRQGVDATLAVLVCLAAANLMLLAALWVVTARMRAQH